MRNLTRPLVAFSTSVAQPCSTTAVRWCWGDTHDDIVSVVWATAQGAAARLAISAASAKILGLDIGVLRFTGWRGPAAARSAPAEPGQQAPGRLVHLRELVAAREAERDVAGAGVDPALEPLDAPLDRAGVGRLARQHRARRRRVVGLEESVESPLGG